MKKNLMMSLAIVLAAITFVSCPSPLSRHASLQVPNVVLPPDKIADVLRATTGDFTYETLFPVALSIETELYDSTGTYAGMEFFRTSGAAVDSIIATLTDPDGNLVYSGRIAGGRLRASVTLPSAPESMTLALHAAGFVDRIVTIPDMVRYSEVNRTMRMLEQKNTARSSAVLTQDTDGDLVPDAYDAFPFNPGAAFAYKIPADGKLTVAFEDLYGQAQAGDADYNDCIVQYSITEVTNASNELHRIEVQAEETVKLARYNHRFGIRVDGFEGSAHLTGVSIDQFGNSVTMDRIETSSANIDLFSNSNAGLLKQATFALEFDTPQVIGQGGGASVVDRPPYNPYLYVLDTNQEIHLMGEKDLSGVAHTYQDAEGFPWGLLVPMQWINPPEAERIEFRYPRFANWRQSFGADYTDWYLHFEEPFVGPDFQVNETQVTFTPEFENLPRLGSDIDSPDVVFASFAPLGNGYYAAGKIYYQRLNADGTPSGSASLISAGSSTDNKFCDISGSHIVYTAFQSTSSLNSKVMYYDLDLGTTVAVTPDWTEAREAQVEGTVVVWTEGPNGATQVRYSDMSWPTGAMSLVLGGPSPAAADVNIGSRFVVWEELWGGVHIIAGYDLLTGAMITITNDADIDHRQPSTSGLNVAWTATDSAGGTTIRIANLSHKPIVRYTAVDNGAAVRRPWIDGDLVAFESDLAGNWDIYLYRISDGRIFQITSNPADDILVNLQGNRVAYMDDRNGSTDIFVSTFTLPPVQ